MRVYSPALNILEIYLHNTLLLKYILTLLTTAYNTITKIITNFKSTAIVDDTSFIIYLIKLCE